MRLFVGLFSLVGLIRKVSLTDTCILKGTLVSSNINGFPRCLGIRIYPLNLGDIQLILNIVSNDCFTYKGSGRYAFNIKFDFGDITFEHVKVYFGLFFRVIRRDIQLVLPQTRIRLMMHGNT